MPKQALLDLFADELPTDREIEIQIKDIEVLDYISPDKEMVESVRRYGIIERPILCLLTSRSKKKYGVINGRRRILSAIICGHTKIKAILREGFSYSSTARALLTLETQRRVNPNPISEYRAIKTMIADGYSRDEIQDALSISKELFDKLASLGALPEDMLKAVSDRSLALGTAWSVVKMSDRNKEEAIQIFRTSGHLKGADLREIRQAKRGAQVQQVMDAIHAIEPEPAKEPSGKIGNVDLRKKIKALIKPDSSALANSWNSAIEEVLKIL